MRIKREVFPYDNDVTPEVVASWVKKLADCNGHFLRLYTVDDVDYIEIKNFKKHQDIHPREKPSELPGPPKAEQSPPKASLDRNEAAPCSEIIPLPSGISEISGTPDSPSPPARACSNSPAKEPEAHDWLTYYNARFFAVRGKQRGGGEADSRATSRLADQLHTQSLDEAAKDWESRERIVDEFLARADQRTVEAGHPFAFFVASFDGLRVPPERRPKQPARASPGARDLRIGQARAEESDHSQTGRLRI